MPRHILIVDDDEVLCVAIRGHLETGGYCVFEAHSLKMARDAIQRERINAILLELNLPDGNGLDLIAEIKEELPHVSIIVITGVGDIPTAVEAMRRGANHFATKPILMKDLSVVLEKSIEIDSLKRIADLGTHRRREELHWGKFLHVKCRREAEIAAKSESPVLIQGETGTGKSLMASWINRNSSRRAAAFVHINCASLKGDILASELFGHARGAFTGAVQQKEGLLEIADGGTLFLDEIGDMDPAVQSQLLNVFERKTFRRMGEVKDRFSDFRLLCATNKNLQNEVVKGRFRQDLLFRISVVTIKMPPLRDYVDELPQLCAHILNSLSSGNLALSPELYKTLSSYAWPGNIRELRNVLERAALICNGTEITAEHLPFDFFNSSNQLEHSIEKEIGQMEIDHIREVISRCRGNLTKAAKLLGVSRATLYRRLAHGKTQLH